MKIFTTFLFLSMVLFSSCDFNKSNTTIISSIDGIEVDKLQTDIGGLSTTAATIKTIHGDIVFRFYTKAAPRTSARVMQLILAKFYDGLLFHRAIPNFIIQAGDPTGTGNGGSGTKLKSEFNELQHIKGTIAMARGMDKDSGDSQFYICLTTLSHLDGKNTIFGQVVDGLEVLPKLSKGDRIISITLNIKN
ncbi:MAG: peptidylprolyl isomerase [Alphaproteobacteria bacterium]|nr:MAG: peptidylprolyl isomerase [Alphaproteobacteria bacterium]